jgi:hypothetical protein
VGIEIRGFIGRKPDLRAWKMELPAAVVCKLGNGDLGLIPLTDALAGQLRARTPSIDEWLSHISRGTAVAYFDIYEFGNDGHEKAAVWVDGNEKLRDARVADVIAYFRDELGVDVGSAGIDVERHRGETAAEKWAAREAE